MQLMLDAFICNPQEHLTNKQPTVPKFCRYLPKFKLGYLNLKYFILVHFSSWILAIFNRSEIVIIDFICIGYYLN